IAKAPRVIEELFNNYNKELIHETQDLSEKMLEHAEARDRYSTSGFVSFSIEPEIAERFANGQLRPSDSKNVFPRYRVRIDTKERKVATATTFLKTDQVTARGW